ncbi:MAG: hypothetical protein V4735_01235 [Pseudomonadota bacterium]
MSADQLDALRVRIASRMREGAARGQAESAVIAQFVGEQVALAKALTDHAFIHAMADGYIKEVAVQQPNPAYAVTMEQAHLQIENVIQHRIADAQQCVRTLADPAFIASARAAAAQPAPRAAPYQLPADKVAVIVNGFVQLNARGGAEPPIHAGMSMMGHQIGHQALSELFRPAGRLRAPLVHALATAWPQASGEVLENFAATWLEDRQVRAKAVADAVKPGGAIYTQAMRGTVQAAQQKHAPAPAPAAPAPPPASSVSGPKNYRGTVNAADLAMEVV